MVISLPGTFLHVESSVQSSRLHHVPLNGVVLSHSVKTWPDNKVMWKLLALIVAFSEIHIEECK